MQRELQHGDRPAEIVIESGRVDDDSELPHESDNLLQTPARWAAAGAGNLNLAPTPTYTDNTNAGTATASYSCAGDANHNPSVRQRDLHDHQGKLDDGGGLASKRDL